MSDAKPLRTLEIKPRDNQAIKPAELIQIKGHHELSLNARRAITLLWNNAHLLGVEEHKDYEIEIDDLKPAGHKGYEMVEEAIEALMRAILVIKMPDGVTRRVQFLGGNDLDDPDRPAGRLTYSFDKRLVEVLKESAIWGKISIPVLMAFTTKYAISLYENIAQLSHLRHKQFQEYTLEEFRDLLGVQPGRYMRFGELNKHVIKPAVAEVNALASFGITVLPIKKGGSTAIISVGWWQKDGDQLNESWKEMQRPKVGRRARVFGMAEYVQNPQASPGRQLRRLKQEHRKADREA